MADSQIEMKIKKIKEESYTFKNLDSKQAAKFNSDSLAIGMRFAFSADVDSSRFTIIPTILYLFRDGDNSQEIMTLKTSLEFEVTDLSKLYRKLPEGGFYMPDKIMETIIDVSINSIRGIIAVKTAGNFLSDYPLPLYETETLISSMKNIEYSEKKKPSKSPTKKKTIKKQQ